MSPTPGKAATDLIGEPLADLARPLPHGFMADDDAPRGQPEREAEVEPDGMADDLGRELIPGVAGASGCRHPTPLLTLACRRKRGKARQVDMGLLRSKSPSAAINRSDSIRRWV